MRQERHRETNKHLVALCFVLYPLSPALFPIVWAVPYWPTKDLSGAFSPPPTQAYVLSGVVAMSG